MRNTIYKKIIDQYNQPKNILTIWQIKLVLGSILIYKLLSRDFSNFAFWPHEVLFGWPFDIYSSGYIYLTGIPIIFDLLTFHFIHFFISFPSVNILVLLQKLLIFFTIIFMFSPIKFLRLISILIYILCLYLWGFTYRAGQDIDAMFLLQGSLFVFVFTKFNKHNIQLYSGQIYSGILVIFIIYYFFSGMNKFIDISILMV